MSGWNITANAAPTRKARLASAGVRLVAVLIVLWTCWPYLARPQLEADDFRYLAIVQQLQTDDTADLLSSMIVENRWDHLWWLDIEGKARFFRPTVIVSYWLDVVLFGGGEPEALYFGLLFTNTLLHIFCTLVVLQILLGLLGHGWPAWLAGLGFAGLSCHAEVLWYVSGRTDSMAALGFLLALALHLRCFGGRRGLRYVALPAFAFALFTKELTVAMPALALLADVWFRDAEGGFLRRVFQRARDDLWIFLGYAVIVVVYAAARFYALGSEGAGGLPYPYAVRSFGGEFFEHLHIQIRSYLANLFFTTGTPPFVEADNMRAPWWQVIVAVILLLGATGLLRRDPRFRWFVVLALLTWLPTCFVYVSERYLYLPSLSFVGVIALCVARARGRVLAIAVLAALFWTGVQAYGLHWKHSFFALDRSQTALAKQLRTLEGEIEKHPGKPILYLNFPGDWADAQFLQYATRVNLKDPKREVRVLTLMPQVDRQDSFTTQALWKLSQVKREDERSILVTTRGTLIDGAGRRFPSVRFESGVHVEGPALGFRVEVVAGTGSSATELRFRFERPLEDYVLVRFKPPAQQQRWYQSPGEVVTACSASILKLPRR